MSFEVIAFFVIRQILNSSVVIVAQAFWGTFLPYKESYRPKKSLIFLLHYLCILGIDLMRGLPAAESPTVFMGLTLSYFAVQLVVLFRIFEGNLAFKLLLFFLNKVIEAAFITFGQTLLNMEALGVSVYFPEDPRILTMIILFVVAILICAAAHALFVVAVRFVGRIFKKQNAILPVVLLPISQLAMLLAYFFAVGTGNTYWNVSWQTTLIIVAASVACISNVVLFVIIFRVRENAQLEDQLKTNALQQRYYSLLEKQQAKVRELQHDIGNHLATIEALAKASGNDPDIRRYVSGLEEEADELVRLNYCENRVLNALLVEKAMSCKEAAVETDFQVSMPSDIFVDEVSLISVFSNILDNAIEAASLCDGKRYVLLNVSCRSSGIAIKCENSCGNGSGYQQSSKLTHGNGRKILRRIADRYNGEIHFESEDSMSSVSIVLFTTSN